MAHDEIKLLHHRSVPYANVDTRQFAEFIARECPRRFLDIGTGSGYIAIRVAQTGAQVVASDISEHSVKLAQENAELNQVHFPVLQSDLFENISGVFDGIAFNCPFSMSRDVFPLAAAKELIRKISPLERYFLHNVPAAVVSFRRQLLARFISESRSFLSPTGALFLMLLGNEKSWIENEFREMTFFYVEDDTLKERNLCLARMHFK